MTGAARPAPALRRELLLFLLALAATVAATWPLATELFSFARLSDKTLDDHVYWWDFWWIRQALVVRHVDPLFCPDVFWPHGANVAVSPLALPYGLLALPLQAVFGELQGAVVAVKLFGFLTFPVALHGTSLLVRRFGVGFWPSVLAGALFAFPPFRILHLGRIHYLAGALVPWFLWAGLRAGDAGLSRRARVGRVGLAALLFALAGATDASLLFEMALAAFAVCVFEWRRGARPLAAAGRWCACGLIGALLLSPLLVPFLTEAVAARGRDAASRLEFEETPSIVQKVLSPDLVGVVWHVLPACTELVAMDPAERALPGEKKSSARLSADNYESLRPPSTVPGASGIEAGVELLALVVVVVALAIGVRQRGAWTFAALAAFGFVLALGPLRGEGEGAVHLPLHWLTKVVPGLAAGRYPAAFLRTFELGTALAAGLAGIRAPRWLTVAAAVAVAVDLATAPLRPLRFAPVEIEEAHELIRADPATGAVLELPPRLEIGLRRMGLEQIVHGHPLLAGPLTRVRPEARAFFEQEPLVQRLLHPPTLSAGDDARLAAEIREDQDVARRYDLRWIVLRRTLALHDAAAFVNLLDYVARHGWKAVETREGHWLVRIEDA